MGKIGSSPLLLYLGPTYIFPDLHHTHR